MRLLGTRLSSLTTSNEQQRTTTNGSTTPSSFLTRQGVQDEAEERGAKRDQKQKRENKNKSKEIKK
jgi:hypothetical protein